MAVTTDYYELLEIERGADDTEIKRAYRAVARRYHPDNNPGDADAEARFKQVATAYETLRDPQKRAHYDRFGADDPRGSGGGDPFGFGGSSGGFGDIFEAFFSGQGGGGGGGRAGPASGPDLEVTVEIDFEAAVFGGTEEVSVRTAVACDTCEATGAAPGSHAERCDQCGGAGQVRQVRQSILGQMVTAVACPVCQGQGQVIADPCKTCRGEGREILEKTYTVDIPAGVDSGSTLRLTGFGAVGPRGGGTGDLYVHVRVRHHERFERDGSDLVHELHVPMTQAALGAVIGFETLDGTEDLVVPRGSQTGKVFRLRGRGVPHVRGRGRGDLLVALVVDTPTDLDSEDDAALREIAERQGHDVAPQERGVLGRIKSAFS